MLLPALAHGARAVALAPSAPIGFLLLAALVLLDRDVDLDLRLR